MSQPSRHMVALPVAVPALTYDGLGRLAKQAGMRRELYAAQLLVAAYSARVKPNGDDPELEAAVAELQNDTASQDDTIRHLVRERDGWKKTAKDLRVQLNNVRAEMATLSGTNEARHGRIKTLEQELSEEAALRVGAIERLRGAEAARDSLRAEVERLTKQAEAVRPMPPIVTVTAKPALSPESRKAISAMLSRPGPLMPGLQDIEIIPPKQPAAPMDESVVRHVRALRAAGNRPAEIARAAQLSPDQVKSILEGAK